MLTARVLEDPDALVSIRGEWDEMAVEAGRPFTAPAWVLAWLAHLRPDDARLHVIVTHDGDRLTGVIPLIGVGHSYTLAGASVAPVEPLSKAGSEAEVARAAAPVLAALTPHPARIDLQRHESAPDWAGLLGEVWPRNRGVWQWVGAETRVPCIDLGDHDFDGWMDTKSASFRRDVRRKQRKLEEDGASFRFATESTLERDVHEFMRLHRARLSTRGGSDLSSVRVEQMLITAGLELLPAARFRILCLEMEEKVIAAQLLLAAGDEVSAWNSGFDEGYAKYSPSMQCIIHALTDAAARGSRTMSLGPGGQDYKYRLANRDENLSSNVLLPRGATYPLARMRLAPRQLRRTLGRRLSPEVKQRLRLPGRR